MEKREWKPGWDSSKNLKRGSIRNEHNIHVVVVSSPKKSYLYGPFLRLEDAVVWENEHYHELLGYRINIEPLSLIHPKCRWWPPTAD